MSFGVPNANAGAHLQQSALDSSDIDALQRGIGGDGVVSGCAVTVVSGLAIHVATGSVSITGIVYPVTATTLTLATASASGDRRDIITVGVSGTPSSTIGVVSFGTVVKPAIPAASVILAEVYVEAHTTTLQHTDITDKRLSTTLSAAALDGGSLFDVVEATDLQVGIRASKWGIRDDGTPYYDAEGAQPDELAQAIVDPDTGAVLLTSLSDAPQQVVRVLVDPTTVDPGHPQVLVAQEDGSFRLVAEVVPPSVLPRDAAGWLHSNGSGRLSFSTPSAADVAAIAKSLGNAKGDLIAFTAAGTPVRVPVGADSEVLTAASAQPSGMSWVVPSSSNTASVNTAVVTTSTFQLPSYADYTEHDLTVTVDTDIRLPNPVAGESILVYVTQDVAGSHAVTFSVGGDRSKVLWPGNGNPFTPDLGAHRMSRFLFECLDGVLWRAGDLLIKTLGGLVSDPVLLSTTTTSSDAPLVSPSFTAPLGELILVAAGLFVTINAAVKAFAITDTLGLTWTQVPGGQRDGPTNQSVTSFFYAIGNGATGTVTVTPSHPGDSDPGMSLDVYGVAGHAGVGATGTSTGSLTVALSAAPAPTSEVLALLVGGLGSDPECSPPAGMTGLITDRHTPTYTFVNLAYRNDGSPSQSMTFGQAGSGGSLAASSAVAIEILAPDSTMYSFPSR